MISGQTILLNTSNRKSRRTAAFPLAEADRCVLCGLCLPHCPTYRLTQDENESPRGRISLMRAAASASLPLDLRIAAHLSRCLGCRACERVCPSGVRYGRLIEACRVAVTKAFGLRIKTRLGLVLVAHMNLLKLVAAVLRLYQQLGGRHLMRAARLLRGTEFRRLDQLLPQLKAPPSWKEIYPAHGVQRGRVALFVGCVARVVDHDTIATAIRLLNRLGFEVRVPPAQSCCGGLHREAGDLRGAEKLLTRNIQAFGSGAQEPIVTLASGCGAAFRAESSLAGSPREFEQRVQDIHTFLTDLDLPPELELEPMPQTVAVHDPCSLRNGLRSEQAVYRLLARIPQLRVEPLPENSLCCGGAGGYLLREPAIADRLRAPKIKHIASLRPDYLVSANLGCALHLSAGLREQGLDIPVIHPVMLFDRQLRVSRLKLQA